MQDLSIPRMAVEEVVVMCISCNSTNSIKTVGTTIGTWDEVFQMAKCVQLTPGKQVPVTWVSIWILCRVQLQCTIRTEILTKFVWIFKWILKTIPFHKARCETRIVITTATWLNRTRGNLFRTR